MEYERQSIIKWLTHQPEAHIEENAKSIVGKLTDQEIATLYLAILKERDKYPKVSGNWGN